MENTLENEMLDAAISWCDSNGINVLEPEQLSNLVNSLYVTVCDAALDTAQPALSGCACRWDADDKRVATCVRHQGWLDVVSEWAERAKAAESQQAQPSQAVFSDAKSLLMPATAAPGMDGKILPVDMSRLPRGAI